MASDPAEGRPPAPCPDPMIIERLADGETVDPAIEAHARDCPLCAERLRSARDNASFLGRVRELASPEVGPMGAPRLPGYRSLSVINSGAQGIVFRGVQESTSRPVAIKVLAGGESVSPRRRWRAEREAEIAARLRHPNIVTVYESRVLPDGRIVVVMEYVDGVPLDQWIPPANSPVDRRRRLLQVFAAVCNGIHHAHLNGVIHRDLKPDNILVTSDARPVVLDFGIAKAGGIGSTLTGEFAGTPAYASPEQASGRPDEVDALTDVYSLGVILYRLLTGRLPYDVRGSIFEIARTINEAQPAPMPEVPADMQAIVHRAMRKDKDRRYQSAAALARDIERVLLGEPVEARGESGWYLLRKAVLVNRRRLGMLLSIAIALAAAGVVVAFSLARAAESSRRAAAEREATRAESVRARAVTELLREAMPNADPQRPEIGAIVDLGLSRLYLRLETGAFADEPDVDQAVRRLWAGVYTGLGTGKAVGLVQYAEVSLRNGLQKARREHPGDHPDVAAMLHELGGVLFVRLRTAEAEQVCREALAMRERLDGPDSTLASDSRALLARVLMARGRDDDASKEAARALAVFVKLPDAQGDLRVASMQSLLARVNLLSRNLAVAEPAVRDALTRQLRRLAPEDPELGTSLLAAADVAEHDPDGSLAGLLAEAWNVPRAQVAAKVRVDVPRLSLPDRGTNAHIYLTGRTDALGATLALAQRLLGNAHPALVRILISQIRASESERHWDVKQQAATRAAAIMATQFGPDDSSVVVCLDEASMAATFAGQLDDAVTLARRACEIRDRTPAAIRDPLLDADTRRNYAWYLTQAERYDDAAKEWRTACDELRAALGPDHHAVALTESGLAYCLVHTGGPDDLEQARALSAHAIEIARSKAAAPDQRGHIRFARGHVLLDQARTARSRGQEREARELYQQAGEMLRLAWPIYESSGLRYRWRRAILDQLAEVSEALGDHAAAQRWLDQREHDPNVIEDLRN